MSESGFPPGRDHGSPGRWPIHENMSSAVEPNTPAARTSDLHLLRDCLAIGRRRRRPSAKLRLEEELGPELARRLLRSLGVQDGAPR